MIGIWVGGLESGGVCGGEVFAANSECSISLFFSNSYRTLGVNVKWLISKGLGGIVVFAAGSQGFWEGCGGLVGRTGRRKKVSRVPPRAGIFDVR